MDAERALNGNHARRGTCSNPIGLQALRLVLVTALDRETASACLGQPADAAATLWPSGLYANLAVAATQSPLVWHRCRELLDASLGDISDGLACIPPIEVARLFAEGRKRLPVRELAGMMWSLLRRSQSALDSLIARLGSEFEVIVTERAAEQWSPAGVLNARHREGLANRERPHANVVVETSR